jgi:hypothetical protein
MVENVVTRDDPQFHLGMRTLFWYFRGLPRTTERRQVTYFRFCSHGGVHFNKIGRYLLVMGM